MDGEEESRDYLSSCPCMYMCNTLMSLLTLEFCFLCCILTSEADRGNVARCNPIGIDFNQDNVPACLITVSERHAIGKDHLPNAPKARLEQN